VGDLWSLTKLVKHFDLSLSPATIAKALIKAEIMWEMTYLSTTGSGKEKVFKEIMSDYLEYGINRTTMHEFKTEPRFYIDRFPDLVVLVIKQLSKESGEMYQ
jgi:hypothetical protein